MEKKSKLIRNNLKKDNIKETEIILKTSRKKLINLKNN